MASPSGQAPLPQCGGRAVGVLKGLKRPSLPSAWGRSRDAELSMGAVVWARPGDRGPQQGAWAKPSTFSPCPGQCLSRATVASLVTGLKKAPEEVGVQRPAPLCPHAGGSPTTPRTRAAQDSHRPAGATPTAPQHPPLYLSTPLHPEHPPAPQHPHCTSLGTSRGAPGIYLRSWLDKLGQAWAQSGGVLGADAPQLSPRGHTDSITAKPGWRALEPQSVSLP